MPVLDHVGERLARLDFAFEGEEIRAHRVGEPAVGDDHVEDRLRLAGDAFPDADRLEQPPRRRDDRRGAFVIGMASLQRRIGDRDRKRRPKALPQGDCERQPGKTAAGDQHVNIVTRHGCILARSAGIGLDPLPDPVCKGAGRNPGAWRGNMTSAVQELVETLDLEPLESNLFRGRSPQTRWQRVFGGQVIGQALVAACRTVEDVAARPPHSLHAYFLLGGDPKVPIIYEVDRIRDGKSFTTRSVKAIQHGHPIFSMAVSFHVHEEGLSHQFKMPDVPKPDELPSEAEMKERVWPMMPEPVRRYYERERPIELRPVEFGRYLGETSKDGRFHVWIRATGRLPDEPAIHQCVLAYASDMMLLDAALIPHGRSVFAKISWRQASTMRCGFTGRSAPTSGCSTRRTVRASPAARGFSRGLIFASDGTLVASVAQEGLLRLRRSTAV